MKKLNWQAVSNSDRNQVIEEVKNVISYSAGCIMNFNMYSDLAMSLSIEIEEDGIADLHQALSNVVSLSELDLAVINPNSRKEWMILMNLSFASGTGEVTYDIPEVPG